MRRGFRRGFGRRKRSVSWTPGITELQTTVPLQTRTTTFAILSGGSNTYAASFALLGDSDLQLHGGEDAVVVRIRGRLRLYGARIATDTASPLFARIVIAQMQVNEAGSVDAIDYTTQTGLGRDDIMWCKDILIGATTLNASTTPMDCDPGLWHDIDVRAKRKLASGWVPSLWIQTCKAGANVPQDFQLAGGLRTLLMRPR